ncbi:MAG: peptidylprolyl isomerase [Oscillospiraceae bacterium]
MANELSSDTGSNTNGGLYTQVYKGQMVTEFNDWCFDESRQPGDTGIVYNEGSYTGYHVIYFVGTDAPYWQVQVRNAMKNADYTQWNNALVKDITATETSGMKYLA